MKTTEFIGAAERQLYELASRMVAYNAGDPKRIQHLTSASRLLLRQYPTMYLL